MTTATPAARSDVNAHRLTLTDIIARLEQQRELACQQYLLARAWMDRTWLTVRAATTAAERRRALEAHLAAQEALSEAEGVSGRLDIHLERYRLALDDLGRP